MIFSNKGKKSVIEFFDYVALKMLPNVDDPELLGQLKTKILAGRELILNYEWGVAFENLAAELEDNYLIVNREGEAIVEKVIKYCKLNRDWVLKLRRLYSNGYKPGSWRLVDCELLAADNKYTFYKPSRKITNNLEVGNIVKLNFAFESTNDEDPGSERMWIVITEKNHDSFKGTLDNNPFYLSELYYGDELEFEHKHIIDHDLELSEANLVDKYLDKCFVNNDILY